MIIIPAIDLKNGKCVRLIRGDYSKVSEYSSSPVEQAIEWQKQGGELLHIIDLDGAKDGSRKNYAVIAEIIKSLSIPVEVGGGARSIETVKFLIEIGARYVILGTAAVKDETFLKKALSEFSDYITVGIDAKNNFVATDGWLKNSEINYIDFAQRIEKLGCKRIIYTDISRDGMLSSPNFENTKKLADSVQCSIIASGGVSSINDILTLANLQTDNITGVITGKALYENKFILSEAIHVLKKNKNIL